MKYITLIVLVLFSLQGFSQGKYSLDSEKSQERKAYKERKRDKPKEIRIEDRIIKKTIKKEKRKKRKEERLHKRAVKKHNRKINGGGKDLVSGRKVNKRMRQSKREARRINKGKNPVPWHKRIFK
ncbi:MAG TPA: hypothetical protein PLO05_02610 [Bacteroidales bacterium]|nr:hypothetical protein [Bacteroidales bacterium]